MTPNNLLGLGNIKNVEIIRTIIGKIHKSFLRGCPLNSRGFLTAINPRIRHIFVIREPNKLPTDSSILLFLIAINDIISSGIVVIIDITIKPIESSPNLVKRDIFTEFFIIIWLDLLRIIIENFA